MPELPEVETVRRGLMPFVEGGLIKRVEQRRADLRFPFPQGFVERLSGQSVEAISRRAKYLLWHLEGGETLICHLGMSGSFRVETTENNRVPVNFTEPRSNDEKHDHVVFHLTAASGQYVQIVFNDPRRFGFMLLGQTNRINEHPLLMKLGIEPTGNALSGDAIAALFAGKKSPLKAALLDQRLIAGLGNIYVCEALWRSGLSPKRAAGTLCGKTKVAGQKRDRLSAAIRQVIEEAIIAGGSSLRDHRQTDGSLGYFQHSFNVYDRENQDCRKQECNGTIGRLVQSGRSTFYCPRCQR